MLKNKPKNAIDILKDYLVSNGYDGLYNPVQNCYCQLDILGLCENCSENCLPGHRIDRKDCEKYIEYCMEREMDINDNCFCIRDKKDGKQYL